MRYKFKAAVTVVLLISIIGVLFSGCGDKIDTEVCVLMGNTKNVEVTSTNLFSNELKEATEQKSQYCVITLDGSPKIGYSGKFMIKKKLSGTISTDGYTRKKIRVIQNSVPETPEIDIISGIKAAASKLAESSMTNKKLLIYSSGISTTGALDFSQNPELIYKNPETVAELLKNDLDDVDLSGIDIVWCGINNVADSQEKLSSFEERNLREIWKQILLSCNADESRLIFKPYVKESADYQQSMEEKYGLDEMVDRTNFPDVTPVKFRFEFDQRVKFKSGGNELVDEKSAGDAIAEFTNKMEEYGLSNQKTYVVGLTADADTYEDCLERSRQRAEKIAELLCKNGLREENVIPIGIGKYKVGDLRVDDSDSPSEENRKVLILFAESAQGKEFIKAWNAADIAD